MTTTVDDVDVPQQAEQVSTSQAPPFFFSSSSSVTSQLMATGGSDGGSSLQSVLPISGNIEENVVIDIELYHHYMEMCKCDH